MFDLTVKINSDVLLLGFIYGLRDTLLMVPAIPFHIIGFLRWKDTYKIYLNKKISETKVS